jgi:hypothetical protein
MKIADGVQYEVWRPEHDAEFPKGLVYVGFDRDQAIAAVDEALAEHVNPDHIDVIVGGGFDVYSISTADLRDKT